MTETSPRPVVKSTSRARLPARGSRYAGADDVDGFSFCSGQHFGSRRAPGGQVAQALLLCVGGCGGGSAAVVFVVKTTASIRVWRASPSVLPADVPIASRASFGMSGGNNRQSVISTAHESTKMFSSLLEQSVTERILIDRQTNYLVSFCMNAHFVAHNW